MSLDKYTIGIVGSGNVAHHLAHYFSQHAAINFKALYTRNKNTGQEITKQTNSIFVEHIANLKDHCNLIILCVSDDSIEKLSKELGLTNQIVCHSSGVVNMLVLKNASTNFGSFYPLQTFTKTRHVNLNQVPFLVDASSLEVKMVLMELASLISENVHHISDENRRKLHVAAVIVNNFSNHLFALSKDYTDSLNLDFNLLKPLMQETVLKAMVQNPKDVQTGPARRKDKKTIAEHQAMLKDPKLKELYLWFTESIEKYYE